MTESTELLVQRDGAVATVVLNRPEQRNAITLDMWQRLPGILRELDADPSVRAVIVTGAGDAAFSAGADIKEFEATRSTPDKAANYREQFEAACDTLAELGTPTIAVVRGYCIGGGFELALSADLRIAAEGSSFGIPAARLGIAIVHQVVARIAALAGPSSALYLLMSGRHVPAEQALAMGLLNEVHPPGALDERVAELVRDITELSPLSHRVHKGVVQDLTRFGTVDAVPPDLLRRPLESTMSADFQEGVRAFTEKRKPRFPDG